MSSRWFIGFITAWVMMTVIACICEMTFLSDSEIGILQQLLSPEFPDYKIPIIGQVAGFLSVAWDYIRILWTMFWFDYPMFQGTFALVRYMLLLPISVGVVVGLVITLIRGVSSR